MIQTVMAEWNEFEATNQCAERKSRSKIVAKWEQEGVDRLTAGSISLYTSVKRCWIKKT